MAKFNKNKCFRVRVQGNDNKWADTKYKHLTIEIIDSDSRYSLRRIEISWQTDSKSEYWYGCTPNIKSDRIVDFEKGTKLFKKIEIGYSSDPNRIIEKLEELGYTQVEYHYGLSEYFPVEKFPAGDTYMAYTGKSNLMNILASSQEEAVKKFKKIAVKQIEKGSNIQEWAGLLANKNTLEIRKIEDEIKVGKINPKEHLFIQEESTPA
jgi:hypothetical protein